MTNKKGGKSPKSNAERQAAFRARNAAKSMAEVRGIFASESDAKTIRDFAIKLTKNKQK